MGILSRMAGKRDADRRRILDMLREFRRCADPDELRGISSRAGPEEVFMRLAKNGVTDGLDARDRRYYDISSAMKRLAYRTSGLFRRTGGAGAAFAEIFLAQYIFVMDYCRDAIVNGEPFDGRAPLDQLACYAGYVTPELLASMSGNKDDKKGGIEK